ncbi:MAG: GNAT family N-acetyltransferase [Firmicutes bacterium]|nr:GNAT family N-acetyltransferase [Bacillota bacterium]
MKFINVKQTEKYYEFELNLKEEKIGLATINLNNQENIIYFEIFPSFQGLGYGHKIFEYLVNELQKLNFKQIMIKINNDNIKALKIFNKYYCQTIIKNNEFIKLLLSL